MENQNAFLQETNEPDVAIKKEKKFTAKEKRFVVMLVIPLALFLLIMFLGEDLIAFPDRDFAEEYAKETLINHVANSNGGKVSDIEITSYERKRFKDESEDEVGFFEYTLNQSITSDGVQYENYKEFFYEEHNADIYKVTKYAHTFEGTCTIKDRDGSSTMEKDFKVTIVQVEGGVGFWMNINRDTIFNPGEDIEALAENDVKVYATLTYKGVKNCRVEITDLVKDYNEITIYGKVYITDHYDDKYCSRFEVVYKYDLGSMTYEKKEISMDTPTKSW